MDYKPGDPAYEQWNDRGFNTRFKGNPSLIVSVNDTTALIDALQAAVNAGQHVAVRGGGHCLENFVADPAVRVIIDISQMKGIRYDPERNAIEVKAGNTVGEMHDKLFTEWGIVMPVGEEPNIGMGGHIAGGAFGFLCRQHGLGVDHLQALELLWVNKERRVEKIVVSRESEDENRELWWAHTGGGTGNFGIVTRYWFRSPSAMGTDPARLLPAVSPYVETVNMDWSWDDFDQSSFQTLVNNFGNWCKINAGNGISARTFFGTLHLWNRVTGKLQLKGLVTDPANAESVLGDFMQSLEKDLKHPCRIERKKMSWLQFALRPMPDNNSEEKIAFKFKDAFLLKPLTEYQLNTVYKYLTEMTDTPGAAIALATYGGKVNEVPADATATAQRNAIITMSCTPVWTDPSEEKKYMSWARTCYQELFKDQGGAPVPGDQYGGCMIAHPDNDLADPAWNKTGVPWHQFYYQQHYPRLQKIKARWDPLNIFHHALSVRPAEHPGIAP
jgi:FAD binding domain/Berberine and berberine like